MKCPRCGLINPETALQCDCGYDFEAYHISKQSDAAVPETNQRKRKGSLGLAFWIVIGSLRLVSQHPILVAPMVPVFLLAFVIVVYLSDADTALGFTVLLLAISAAALGLMISFGITSQMLKQLHHGRTPSLRDAIFSRDMLRMLPRILGLSVIWYGVVMVLVIIEMIIEAILSRISERLADAVVDVLFGGIADALRMAAFMMVAIMTFEDVGLGRAFDRLRQVVEDQAVASLGGLILTGLASALVGLILYAASWLLGGLAPGRLSFLLMVPMLAAGWLLSIYLEQLFVTGLYLYSTVPDSPVVRILLQDLLGRELPAPTFAREAVA